MKALVLLLVSYLLCSGVIAESCQHAHASQSMLEASASHPNFSVQKSDAWQPGYGVGITAGLDAYVTALLSKNLSCRSRVKVGVTAFFDTNTAGIVDLNYVRTLYWHPRNQLGMKLKLSLNHIAFTSGFNAQVLRANLLAGKAYANVLLFAGYRSPIVITDNRDDLQLIGDIVTGQAYAGLEYKVSDDIHLFSDYVEDTASVGLNYKFNYFIFKPKFSALTTVHPFNFF